MNILVIAATIEEIAPSLPFLSQHDVAYLITGVGMVATTYQLTKRLQRDRVDLVLHVGIGGILDLSAALGDVYRISKDEIFELGADDNGSFLPIEELGFGKRIYTEKAPVNLSLPIVQKARGITVNNVHGGAGHISDLRKQYPNPSPLMESMEGAATFFVAEQEQVDCLQFRAASNYIEPRNRATWEIGLAIKNLNDFLLELLPVLLLRK